MSFVPVLSFLAWFLAIGNLSLPLPVLLRASVFHGQSERAIVCGCKFFILSNFNSDIYEINLCFLQCILLYILNFHPPWMNDFYLFC